MHRITILGSTGSIGVSALDVISRHPFELRVVALTANLQTERLFEQCLQFNPDFAVTLDSSHAELLDKRLRVAGSATQVLCGIDALNSVASLNYVDTVIAAIVGAAGLMPTLSAARAGKRILLANKEALVMAGDFFMRAVSESGALLLPIDSEHNAIYQALPRSFKGDLTAAGVRKIILTASGGPFRTLPLSALENITPDQACAHPNWAMGKKISVDSATMMNKGLEIIEAHWLFSAKGEQIEVLVHPQSIVHSLVEYVDGSVIAQLSNPDMRTPIAYGLGFPERLDAGVERLELSKIGQLNFEAPDVNRFPCLELAYDALRLGGSASAVLNAANEVAVSHFLDKGMAFTEIPKVIEHVLGEVTTKPLVRIEDVLEADKMARRTTVDWIAACSN